MPSLRRSASSSAVRVAPYSSSLVAARGNGHRRSSGSETSSRRVLADIEWWRVTDGQCDPSADQDNEEQTHGTPGIDVLDVAATGNIVVVDVTAGMAPPAPMPLPWISADADVSSEAAAYGLPTEQFSGLSITPHTPTRRHHALESLSSSLESTPEASEAPLGGFALSISDLDMGFFEVSSLPPLSAQRQHRFDMLSPILMRPFMPADASLNDEHTTPYADFAVSPLSSAPHFLN